MGILSTFFVKRPGTLRFLTRGSLVEKNGGPTKNSLMFLYLNTNERYQTIQLIIGGRT